MTHSRVALLQHTPDPEKLVAAAAKLCYSSSDVDDIMDNLTDSNTQKFIHNLMEMGHESPIEHASFTFSIEGVSRSLLAQISRHRIASFSVKSQRYVGESGFEFVMPPDVQASESATKVFGEAMAAADEYYKKISGILYESHYNTMVACGVEQKLAKSRAQKAAIEDARFVLPNACETKMIVTLNARSLKNFFELRCCNRAQWEIRAVAIEMLRLVKSVAPTIFEKAGPACVAGGCSEGVMTCGKMAEVRAFFKAQA